MDYISIENLEVYANHGVFEEEASLGQKFLVSAKMYFDSSEAGLADDLSKTVNYAQVCSDITKWMKDNRCKLIETVAEKLASKILRNNPVIREIEVTIRKPWAPIGLPIECVSITIRRRWHTVYLSIGSNMGDRGKYLRDGIEFLKNDDGVRIIAVSELIETKPYGKVDQADFLNGAVKLETLLTPHELLDLIHRAESAAKRERVEKWGPRTLDLDILLYDSLVVDDKELVIPHPDMINREFVLTPLKQIAPNAYHPVLKKTISQIKVKE